MLVILLGAGVISVESTYEGNPAISDLVEKSSTCADIGRQVYLAQKIKLKACILNGLG